MAEAVNEEEYDPEEYMDETQEGYGDERKQRLETTTEFGQFLITPQKALKKSVYHKFIQKDMAVSYFKGRDAERWVFMIMKYQQLIDNLIFLGLDGEMKMTDKKTGKKIVIPKFNPIVEVATVYDSEKLSLLELLRSVDGFEREKLTTVTHVKKDTSGQQKKGWFNRGG